jgi:hypothetical protein
MDTKTQVMSATLDCMIVLATRLAYLSWLLLLDRIAALHHRAAKQTQSRKSFEGLDLGGFGADGAPDLDTGYEPQQEQRALDAPEFAECPVETARSICMGSLGRTRSSTIVRTLRAPCSVPRVLTLNQAATLPRHGCASIVTTFYSYAEPTPTSRTSAPPDGLFRASC